MPVPLHDYLRRLPPEYYRGQAFVHWSMTIDGRATGWLDEETHLRFRDVQAHLLHRYRLMCPMYCLMPDHVHVFWAGLDANSDQLKAVRFLRDHFNGVLRARGVALQKQCHDNVLREIDRDRGAVVRLAYYLAENPVRAGLSGMATEWAYSGAHAIGYPDLDWCASDFSGRLWKIYAVEVERNAGGGMGRDGERHSKECRYGEGDASAF